MSSDFSLKKTFYELLCLVCCSLKTYLTSWRLITVFSSFYLPSWRMWHWRGFVEKTILVIRRFCLVIIILGILDFFNDYTVHVFNLFLSADIILFLIKILFRKHNKEGAISKHIFFICYEYNIVSSHILKYIM